MTKSLSTARIALVGGSLPNRVQGQPFGAKALPNASKSLGQQPVAILQPGSAQAEEQFSSHSGMPPAVARALNQLQRDIRESTAAARSDPTANKTLMESVALSAGGDGGTNPTPLQHGLGGPYRGYRIGSVRGGYISGHAAVAPTAAAPASVALLLWTKLTPFVAGGAVTADVEIWA